ncbi:integration host factor subunit alpha [Gluconobacter morbifer]|uniref:Integration host factor subunit alpha n=1 Tax=Gluconobacter morbifer G707 TaxID=1088869 RepID=G6XIG6_9PROT|nr:integration host factor subunit alpha [Gluconobacter morbifer]EHH68606.1 integration host factor alpha-subunit [Gluconobacter morbifer G707]
MSTVTRANLVEQIYSRVGLSRHDSSNILESVLENISATLEKGESVKLSGFGSFSVRQKGERIGRNPKTGVEVPILPRAVLVFRPSQLLRARMNDSADAAASVQEPHEQ